MTGVERLRGLADFWRENRLDDIVEQIEREQVEAAADHAIVASVASEMERHVSGVEGMEDSPVARWARELREALGGEGRDYYADPVPRSYAERRISSRQRQIDESHAALRRRNARIVELEQECDELREMVRSLNALTDEMEKRLMPEGMEWPMWDDGKPVTYDDAPDDVIGMYLALDGSGYALMTDLPDQLMSESGERVKRPAPKVLDADGAEIRVGDTVWCTNGHGPFEVTSIVYADKWRVVCDSEKNGHLNVYPESITHRAPVLAADGRPLRVGETVWLTDGSEKHVVLSTEKDAIGNIVTEVQAPGLVKVHISPSRLTHERPAVDTWERITEDIASPYCADYCIKYGVDHSSMSFEYAKACDIVRRAKKLAERGA